MFVVDVVPPGRCYNLFSFIVVMLLPQGRCYSLLFLYILADVLPIFVVTDGIATIFGRCYAKWWCTSVVVVAFWADVIAKLAYVIATKFDSYVLAGVIARWLLLLPL